jgi:hypothetical protein
MADEKFHLPVSSYAELVKIIQGYSHHGGKLVKLDDIAKTVGINRTKVSANNGFLADIGLITGGNTKQASSLATKL